MNTTFVAVSAIVPSLLLIWYFHSRDTFPEPPRALWTVFALGVAIVVPVVAVALPFDRFAESLADPFLYGLASAFLAAAVPEEIFKFVVLWYYAARHTDFDEPMDGIVYGVAASLGFATLENVLYVSQGGISVAILRALTAVPGHAFLGAIMGYWAGQARFADKGERRALLTKALAIPIVLHGLYDFPLLTAVRADELGPAQTAWLYLLLLTVPVILLLEGLWCRRKVHELRQAQRDLAAAAAPVPSIAPGPQPAPATSSLSVPPPLPAAAVAQAPSRPGATVLGWILTTCGFLLATGGGILTLGVVVGILFGGADLEELGPLLVGTAILGGLPLLAGIGLFRAGVGRLNRA